MNTITRIKLALISLTFFGSFTLGCVEDGTDDLTGILGSSLNNAGIVSKVLESFNDEDEEEQDIQ